jgi:repressor LexA
MATFGERLRELRKAMGMKQKELAAAVQMGESTISMYEMEKREPDIETLEMFSDFFNVDINYILGRSETTTYIPSTQSRFIVRKVPVYGRIPAGTPSRRSRRRMVKSMCLLSSVARKISLAYWWLVTP